MNFSRHAFSACAPRAALNRWVPVAAGGGTDLLARTLGQNR